jgi:hypothetical protein
MKNGTALSLISKPMYMYGPLGGILGGVTSVLGAITGQNAAKDASKAAKKAGKLTDLQAQQLKNLQPFIDALQGKASTLIDPIQQGAMDSYTRSKQFDPHQETERALAAYDTAAKDITRKNLESNQAAFASRGFTAGNAPSQGTAADQQILARAANDRGQYASNLSLNEFNRKEEVDNNAANQLGRSFGLLDPSARGTAVAGALQGPINSNLRLSDMYSQQAASANPGALIPLVSGALNGIKWPWQNGSSSGGGNGGLQDYSNIWMK